MLAFLTNLSIGETVMIAVVAILVFGRRLPEVAAQVMRAMRRMRTALDDLKRETGIDREIRSMQSSMQDVAREARFEDPMRTVDYEARAANEQSFALDESTSDPDAERAREAEPTGETEDATETPLAEEPIEAETRKETGAD